MKGLEKPVKVDQIDQSIAIVPEPHIDLSDSSSTPISENSPNLPETNDDVQESFLESFDSERKFLLLNIVNKCPKPNLPIDISKPQESLNVSEMVEQDPSVRDYSIKGKLTQLIEQEGATQSGRIKSTPKGKVKALVQVNQCLIRPKEFNVAGSSNIGDIQSTEEAKDRDSDSDSESLMPVRRSKRRNIGAPPTRYGTVVSHKFIICPTISWLLNIVDPLKLLQ